MRNDVRVALAVLLTAVAYGAVAGAEESLVRRDARGEVAVTVTLLAPPAPGEPIRAKVDLDTHSVALDSLAFDKIVALKRHDGQQVPPAAVEQTTGGGHHRQAVLVFPGIDHGHAVEIVVRNVGGVAERSFSWSSVH